MKSKLLDLLPRRFSLQVKLPDSLKQRTAFLFHPFRPRRRAGCTELASSLLPGPEDWKQFRVLAHYLWQWACILFSPLIIFSILLQVIVGWWYSETWIYSFFFFWLILPIKVLLIMVFGSRLMALILYARNHYVTAWSLFHKFSACAIPVFL